uniref:Fork-head domain-containing protein n=1 Tax=Oncorhynchus tshawytscha TaxID=74940 RepID=A0A8C8JDG0_ONCTS
MSYAVALFLLLQHYQTSQEMIESRIMTSMSGILENSGHHPSPQDYRLLTTDPSQLREEDLPGDLQSLSWLTSVDVPRLQQMADGRGGSEGDFNGPSQGLGASLLEQQTAQMNNITMAGGQGAMIHLQSNMQHSPLGINPSPGYQCPASVYQPTPQQVFTLTQTSQQCTPAGLYGNVSFNNQSLFTQPRLAPQNQDLQPKTFPKPIYSYSCLISMALKNSKTGSLPVSEIYTFMKEHFPYFKTAPDGWKNSVRHNLSLNKCFEKVENKTSGSSRKGCLWALNPVKIDKMEEEMQKWKRKDLPAIRRSMANPDELDRLITDRPESCRRKPMDPGMTRLPICPSGLSLPVPGQMQPQPMVTLSLQCLPMHQHHQLHAQARLAPVLLATQHPGKQPHEFYSLHGEVNAEVDTLDTSIMDFALQGNLWEMKDDSFNLEALGTFSNSPLRLSDCDIGTMTGSLAPVYSGGSMPFSDLQVTGMYTSYAALDTLSSQYMGTPGNSKPITALL